MSFSNDFPINSARFLLKVYNGPEMTAFAEGKGEGSTAKYLAELGYITKFGRIRRRVRWKLVKPLSQEDVNFLRQLVGS